MRDYGLVTYRVSSFDLKGLKDRNVYFLIYKKPRGRQCNAGTSATENHYVFRFLLFLFLTSCDFHFQGYLMDQDGCWIISYYNLDPRSMKAEVEKV